MFDDRHALPNGFEQITPRRRNAGLTTKSIFSLWGRGKGSTTGQIS